MELSCMSLSNDLDDDSVFTNSSEGVANKDSMSG